MRFRRRRFGGRSARPREPLIFDRRNVPLTEGQNIFAASTAAIATLFDPTNVIAGMQDLRLTVRRIRFTACFTVNIVGATLVQNDAIALYLGVLMGQPSENAVPSLIAAGGQREDWLWLGTTSLVFGAAAPQNFTPSILRNIENQAGGAFAVGLIDIKAQRKVDQDEAILLYAQVDNTNQPGGSRSLTNVAHNATAATIVTGSVVSSVLYSRTMK